MNKDLLPSGKAAALIIDFVTAASKRKGDDGGEDVMALQDATFHLLAQQLAFCSTKVPTAEARKAYLTAALQKLSVLIRAYENGIKRGKNEKPVR